ncbi:hypothetical protein ACPW2B_001519 [Proteus mirabilis]|nr:hypothetical protein [Proteus mirabilis]ELB1186350.1 hypothetical protein [Proteus mirabilis]MBI6439970.1 hypothetical protein [Proteus mirabilis]HEK0628067.1 hypothetical protein [Proteus mirabilis]HEK1075725.1 hypothetical protein [Proteus mirabilis]
MRGTLLFWLFPSRDSAVKRQRNIELSTIAVGNPVGNPVGLLTFEGQRY